MPLAKGLLLAASVLLAAGIAIYESPQVRQWVDQRRRKIAVVLHSLGDEMDPRRGSESSDAFEQRKRKQELVRRNRNELVRKAREEGVAVDLDELARIGAEDLGVAEKRSSHGLVDRNGLLRGGATTAAETSDHGLRKRGAVRFAAGAAVANPFSDDNMLFDRDNEEAQSMSRKSSATLEAAPVSPPPPDALIDLSPKSDSLHSDDAPTASPPHLVADEHDETAQSFYSFASHAHSQQANADSESRSTGTLTPRSCHSASIAPDMGLFSLQNSIHNDSDAFSESGFTEAGFSEAGFSDMAERERSGGAGALTPTSWTDVGSDSGSEWGQQL